MVLIGGFSNLVDLVVFVVSVILVVSLNRRRSKKRGRREGDRKPPKNHDDLRHVVTISDNFATCLSLFASQAAWYRMENGPKAENEKNISRKKENGPRPEMGKNWPKNGGKMGFGVIFLFFRHFWAIFPISGHGPFSIFQLIFSHFRPSARFPFYARRPDT